MSSQSWADASPNTPAFTVGDNCGGEGGGGACQETTSSMSAQTAIIPFVPRDTDGA